MKKFIIINQDGNELGEIHASSAREALLIYLIENENFSNDIMIYQSTFDNKWHISEYNDEDHYLMAKEISTESAILARNISNIEKLKLIFNRDKVFIKNRFPELYYLLLEFLDGFKKPFSNEYFDRRE